MDHNSLVSEVVNNPKSPKEFACSNEIIKLRKEIASLKVSEKKEPKLKGYTKPDDKK